MANRIFRIESTTKSVQELEETTFAGNGFLETRDVHEWLVSHPGILGEDLLIIQREHVNVVGNRRRPDILAIDKEGNLVIIEVKRDDSGLDIYWQAALYAASYWPRKASEIVEMYSSYSDLDVDEARSILATHIEAEDITGLEARLNRYQRIILVARTFPREVTTTVLWLNDQGGLDVSCLQLTPHFDSASNSYFLQSTYIIPVPETKELMVEVRRTQQERAKSGAETDARQDDEITQFMFSVADSVDRELSDDIKLTKKSRWAGKGEGNRYFKFWYDGELPWANHEFCYSIELSTEGIADDESPEFPSDVWVKFYVWETSAKKRGLTDLQIGKLKKACKNLEGQADVKYEESRGGASFWIGSWVPSERLSQDGVGNVATAIEFLVQKLTPPIRAILGSNDETLDSAEMGPQD